MKKTFIITFLLTGMFLGIILTMQLQSTKVSNSTFMTDEMFAKTNLLNDYLNEQSYLKSRILTLRKLINEQENSISIHSNSYNIQLLDELKSKIGLKEVVGEGINITLDDNPFASREGEIVSDKNLVQASDIRDIINALKVAHSKDISVNGHRIINQSSITSLGTNILVNNSHISHPFNILAIGNPNELKVGLENNMLLGDFYTRIKNSGLVFQVLISDSISIPIYDGELNTKYLNLIEQ